MSKKKKTDNAPTTISRRTWKVNISCPSTGDRFIEGFRETRYLDNSGNDTGIFQRDITPLSMVINEDTLKTIPQEYRGIADILSGFFDWLEDAQSNK